MAKLGFCFLTLSTPYNIDLWQAWLDHQYSDFCIHAKHPTKLNINFKHRLCPEHVHTQWGGFGLVEASYQMFKYMFQYSSIDKVCLVSDTCIPIKKFNTVYETLMSDNSSFFFYKPLPEWKSQRVSGMKDHFDTIWNQSQWMTITREAFDIIDKYYQYYKNICKKVYCIDEHFFINILLEKGYSNITNTKYHYFQFPRNAPHPLELDTEDFINLNQNSKHLFARKFTKTLDKEFWPIII